MTVAKSLAGGFPLSGVIGRADVMDAAEPGGLGGTYAGSPIACAAALAVFDVIAEEGLIARANVIGEAIKGRLNAIAKRNDTVPIAAIRGPGAMIAFDIVEVESGAPDAAATKRVTQAALDRGLVLLSWRRLRQYHSHSQPAHDQRRAARGRPRPSRSSVANGAYGIRLAPRILYANFLTSWTDVAGRQRSLRSALPSTPETTSVRLKIGMTPILQPSWFQ